MAARIGLNISESAVSTASNTSKVTVNVYYYGNGMSWSNYQCAGTITINGTRYTFSHTFGTSTGRQWIGSASKTITHNSDGSGKATVSATFNTGTSLGTLSASGSLTLTTIARASTLSWEIEETGYKSEMTFGQRINFTISRKSTDFTHTIQKKGGTLPWTTVAEGVYTNCYQTQGLDLAEYFTGTNEYLSFKLITYRGSTKIGEKTYTNAIKMKPSAEMAPSVSFEAIEDATGAYDTYGAYVAGKSKLHIVLSYGAKYGATTVKIGAIVDGKRYGGADVTTEPITNGTIVADTTDTRGMSNTATTSIEVLPYTSPAVSNVQATRCDAEGTPSQSGGYIHVVYDYAVSSLNDLNSKTATLWYRKGDSEEWSSTQLSLDAYEGNGVSIIVPASADVSWELYIEITDDFESTMSAVQSVSSKPIILSISKEGTGVAIGEAAEEDGVLSVALPAVFKGHVTFEDGLSMEPVEQDGWRILTRNDGSVELMKVFTYESTPYTTLKGWSYHQYSLDFPLEMETDYVCIVSWRANNNIMIDGGNSYRTSGSCRIYGATQNSETQTVTSQVLVIGRRA